MATKQRHICDIPGCVGEAEHGTATGQHLCERCYENRVADESACMAGNGAPPPVAFTSWWRRLLHRRRQHS